MWENATNIATHECLKTHEKNGTFKIVAVAAQIKKIISILTVAFYSPVHTLGIYSFIYFSFDYSVLSVCGCLYYHLQNVNQIELLQI